MDDLIELFKFATCTYGHKTGSKSYNSFRFGPNINVLETLHLHKNPSSFLKIISIDLTGSKLGDILDEFRANNK